MDRGAWTVTPHAPRLTPHASRPTLLAPCGAHAGQPPEKPNFIIILIDDMGYGDIGPFGSKLNRTPNLDRMAREGMKFTSFYCASVCTPSRAQMMTGCYAKRVSLPDCLWPVDRNGISTQERTIADLLKARGYATMAIGKWHLGDQPEFLPTRHGFDHYLGLPYSNDMHGAKGFKFDPQHPKRTPPIPLVRDTAVIEAPADQDKLTERYTEEALTFITANKDRPFFLYLPHTAVHVPIHPGKAFQHKSANGRYGDWVEEVDWSTGRILDTLKQLDIDARTLVLFTSDNGPWLCKGKDAGVAGPLRGGKETCWEGGVREPTLVRWPGKIPPGTVCDAIASEIDVLPTFVKLAGGEAPTDRKIDGLDLWPLLSGQGKQSPHEALFYFGYGGRMEAVRSGPWKLTVVRLPGDKEGLDGGKKPFVPKLYNLDLDIGERKDVAAQHSDVVARLQGLIQQMTGDLGAARGVPGPGVRPGGHVENPRPLLMRAAIEYD